MLFKKAAWWGGLAVLLIPLAFGSGLLKEVKPDDLRELSRGRYKLISMIVGCEMDNRCMQVTLTEIIKMDPHPVYENYLAMLNERQDQIKYEQVHCNQPARRVYQREITLCLKDMLKKINPQTGLNENEKQKVEMQTNQCIEQKTLSASKQGNLYAQAAMLRRALKKKDQAVFEHWYGVIQRQRGTSEYLEYAECQEPLEMFELLPNNGK